MPHREYVRLAHGADTAVLFLHGIAGTPRHFDSRLPLTHLVPENWSVYSLLLPGHGGEVTDFSASTMKQWKDYVWHTFEELSRTHQRVILAGHSMGTLFALQLAMEHRQKIPFLFLIASPICPQVSFAAVVHCLHLTLNHRPGKNQTQDAMHASCSVRPTAKLWKYIPWIPNLLDLLAEARKTKKMLPNLQTPTIVFQSRKDELVAGRSAKHLLACPCVRLSVLEKSTHFYYDPADTLIAQQAFVDACNEVRQ